MSLCNLFQYGIAEKIVATFGKWPPRHDLGAISLHDALRLLLLTEHMSLHLVYCRNDIHVLSKVDEVVGIEVCHAYSSHFTFPIGILQSTICAITIAERLMEEYKVNVVSA